MLPATTTRVERNTSSAVNRRIERQIERSIAFYAAHPEAIAQRLEELEREWDMERVLEANAATIGLAGMLLGAFVNKRFLALPIAVTGFLLQHALQGWCPPVPVLRRRGVRTAAEIERERVALKALRGDFEAIGPSTRRRSGAATRRPRATAKRARRATRAAEPPATEATS